MSEEIIIDGVDVAGCEFFDSNYCKLCDMRAALDELIVHRQYCDRTVNNNCYYKQLKRLQAENERLKEENSKIVWNEVCTTNCSKYKAYNKYRKALEEISGYLQQFKKKKSSFYTLNDVVTDIANNIEKIISEVLG